MNNEVQDGKKSSHGTSKSKAIMYMSGCLYRGAIGYTTFTDLAYFGNLTVVGLVTSLPLTLIGCVQVKIHAS